MSGHYRDTQTGSGANFVPKSHSAILINGTTAITFKDRQGVEFVVDPSSSPTLLPISVMEQVTSSTSVVYLT